jgi:hypothetical protein
MVDLVSRKSWAVRCAKAGLPRFGLDLAGPARPCGPLKAGLTP